MFDERHVLDLDRTEVQLIYVGPCHQVGDTIVFLPKERVLFAGDVIFADASHGIGPGSYEKWLKILDLIIALDPEVIVPGHGPIPAARRGDGDEGVPRLRARRIEPLLQARNDLAGSGKRIDLGPYSSWSAPARIYLNVERAYRGTRHEPEDKPWDAATSSDQINKVAKSRGLALNSK